MSAQANAFARLGIGAKLRLAFGALAAVTVVVVIAGIAAASWVTSDIDQAERERLPAALTASQAQASLMRMQLHLRGYLVLGDPLDVEQYEHHRRAFEMSLRALEGLSVKWPTEAAARVSRLRSEYTDWSSLPGKLFELHDNPLSNRPALRLARLEVQPRKVAILDHLDKMLAFERETEVGAARSGVSGDLARFQTSFDAMVGNLMAYAASGELSFRLAYGPQLATNAALWQALSQRSASIDARQRARLDAISVLRSEIAGIGLQIAEIISDDRAYTDLTLYRQQALPQAQSMLTLLEGITDESQSALRADLGRARQQLLSARTPGLLAGVGAVCLAVILVLIAQKYIVQPVRRLTTMAGELPQGDSALPMKAVRADEIGLLEHTIGTRMRQHELEQLTASIPDAIWRAEVTTEGALQVRYHSPVVERITGFAPAYFTEDSERRLQIVHTDDRPGVRSALLRLTAGSSDREEAEYRIERQDGTFRWVRDRVRASRSGDGAIILNGVLSDVTDRHKAEEEVRRLERQLRHSQRLEAIGTLAGGIAHDFNNLLGSILGYGEMAARQCAPGSRLRQDIDSIVAAGERGRALVEQILTFSRSGGGDRRPVHIESVVRETLSLLAGRRPGNVMLESRLSAGMAAVLGDATQIHQVVMNLATNALQAMPVGGTLQVSVDVITLTQAQHAATATIQPGEYVVLAVKDTGQGISRDLVDRIFDPFFTTKEVGGGTGLGLSLVHGIVSSMGGAVDLTSAPGAGSTFTVYLPRHGDATPHRQGRHSELPAGKGEVVMVVDDEEPLKLLVAAILADLGYAPVAYSSASEALAAFESEPDRYDALVTDERMPGLTGASLIRAVRQRRPGLPALLVSGFLGPEVAARARASGANQLLRKPVSRRDLAVGLARALRSSPLSKG
jgi:PAS domain S-box-containing protein